MTTIIEPAQTLPVAGTDDVAVAGGGPAGFAVFMGLIVLLLLAAVLPIAGDRSAAALYHSPVMILLLGLLAGSCVWCCCRTKRSGWRLIGFLLAHLGIVTVLAGGMLGFLFGMRAMVRMPVHDERPIDTVMVDGQRQVPLGFKIAARDFKIAFHPPTYVRWHPLPPEQVGPGEVPFREGQAFETGKAGPWDLGDGQSLAVSNLWNVFRSEWVPQYSLPDGSILAISQQTPSFFGFTLVVIEGEGRSEIPVAVNQPASVGGWIFYLMSYDAQARSYIDISARRDPGRGAVIAGIWMIIGGVFILSFRRTEETTDAT